MADFLLELRTEEIPANALPGARRQLDTATKKLLEDSGFEGVNIEIYSTSRRLAMLITGLPLQQEDRIEDMMGPPVSVAFDQEGKPTKAAEGFARKTGLSLDSISRVQTDRGEYLKATVRHEGHRTAEILTEAIPGILSGLHFPKMMRWGAGDLVFVRPVHGVIALLDDQVLPLKVLGITAGRSTIGHRVHSPAPFEITRAVEYEQTMEEHGVLVRPERRKELLEAQASALAAEAGCRVHTDPGLVREHVELVEYPGLILGSIREEYLELPPEVVISTLRHHQKCLILEDDQENLRPHFLAVIDRRDDPEGLIRIGNEWVIGARLADARFFFEEDLKKGMEALIPGEAAVEWHRILGSLEDKAERTARLGIDIRKELGLEISGEDIEHAARLVKADLLSNMVGEFPELQGIMGGHYLRLAGAEEALWAAARDHYRPVGFDGKIPVSDLGKLLGLVDRLDSICGLFAVGEKPTGSRDPLGLRRAAQAVVKILIEAGWSIHLDKLLKKSLEAFSAFFEDEPPFDPIHNFFSDRVRRWLTDIEKVSGDTADAVMAAGWGNLPACCSRAKTLEEIRGEENFRQLALAFKRVANITEGRAGADKVDPKLFEHASEQEIYDSIRAFHNSLSELLPQHRIREAFEAMLPISEKLENFFIEVLVMADDEAIRANRIALLKDLGQEFLTLADLSKLQIEGS